MLRVFAFAWVVATAGAALAQTDGAGDPAAGAALAAETCSVCHSVTPDNYLSPLEAATPFLQIAETPSLSALAIRVFLQTPHRNMPNLILTPQEIDDVIAYIETLRPE